MANYTKTTNFTAKDSLITGDANKLILGAEIDTEFSAIATSNATKANKISSATANNVVEQDSNGDLVDTGLATPTGAFVGTTDTQTLTNKTLTAPVISSIVNTGTLTLPTSTDTVVARDTTDTLNNKTLNSPTISGATLTSPTVSGLYLPDNAIIFEGPVANSFETTLAAASQSADRVVTLPNASTTLVGLGTIDTLTNKTLTSAVLNTSVSGSAVLDEDTMSSDASNKLATQQSIKAYVDNANNLRGCSVYLDANTSITTASLTTLAFDQEDYDTDAVHSNSTNNSRLTVPSGVTEVRLYAEVHFLSNATGIRYFEIHKGGSFYPRTNGPVDTAPTGVRNSHLYRATPTIAVSSGNYFELKVYQSSGGNLDVSGSSSPETGTACRFVMEIVN